MHSHDLTEAAVALWRANGGPAGQIKVRPCTVSGNNRIFILQGSDARTVVAKCYFRGSPGGIARLNAEWKFLDFAARAGIDCVPRPVAHDAEGLLALHQFREGRKLTAAEVGEREIFEAASFIRTLNKAETAALAVCLPLAAEACFSMAEHFALVDHRIHRLADIQPVTAVDAEAAGLVAELSAYWSQTKVRLTQGAEKLGLVLDQQIPSHERVISPSDFGFHNALAVSGGGLVYIDFEYAGWDDVAKLSADFFFQPAVPVSDRHYESFLDHLLDGKADAGKARLRCRLLRPLFGVKWCCIMLNRFMPNMAARSQFADPGHDEMQRKTAQMAKAASAFNKLVSTQWVI